MKKRFLFIVLFPFAFWGQSALEQLEQSPRHHEWVTVEAKNNSLKGFLVYPEVAENVPVILLIHENRGLNDWARSMADQIAAAGYIVFAPDLLSGSGPKGGGTASFENSDKARTGIYNLDPDQVTQHLNASVAYAKTIPSGNGKVAVIGFCWGGSQSFRFASNNNEIETAIVCYGSGPKDTEAYKNIQTPVYGFYGGNDNRVNATIENSQRLMESNGNFYEVEIYKDAGHGFFRSGEDPNASEANKNARNDAWIRLKSILAKI